MQKLADTETVVLCDLLERFAFQLQDRHDAREVRVDPAEVDALWNALGVVKAEVMEIASR